MQTTSQPAASPAHLAHPAAHAVTWAEMAPHRSYLVSFARRRLLDPALAEDLVHDVFEAVATGRAEFGGRAAVRSWLVAMLAYSRAAALLGAGRAGFFGALVPGAASLLAIALLGEVPSTLQWLGIVAVVCGLLIAFGALQWLLRRSVFRAL